MLKKRRVAVLFGGKSAEHEISLRSARNIAEALDKKKYDVKLIGITKSGAWLPPMTMSQLANATRLNEKSRSSVALVPEGKGAIVGAQQAFDVVFPVLHGPFGEDGTVQGLLRLANVPFVGAGVLGSAVGMDKDVMKRLLREAEVPVAKFLVAHSIQEISFQKAKRELGLPLFVKPANLGSSVGVSKVRTPPEYSKALREAFRYDTKVMIEEFIKGREIECSVLGNEKPIASVPGEVVVHTDFYSYETKYVDENGATLRIPAQLSNTTVRKIQKLAIKTFKTLACEGMGRVDFFVTDSGKVFVNEINTIPGFTNISMYPKLWEASGVSYSELIDRLVTLAIERFKKQQRLRTSR